MQYLLYIYIYHGVVKNWSNVVRVHSFKCSSTQFYVKKGDMTYKSQHNILKVLMQLLNTSDECGLNKIKMRALACGQNMIVGMRHVCLLIKRNSVPRIH